MTHREATPPLAVEDEQSRDDADRVQLAKINAAQQPPAPPVLTPPRTAPPHTFRRAPLPDPTQQVTPETRQRVEAAVAFHLGGKLPGIEWGQAVDPIVNRFLQLTGDNPALVAALEADVNTMFALTDRDIAERIMRGEPVSQFGDVFDAIAEVAWEVGATELAARIESERADAIGGTFDALTEVEALTLGLGTPTGETPGTRVTPNVAKARTFETLFDVPGAWSFSPSEGLLVVTVGGQTVGVQTRPGFDPENHLDVMAEVVSAQADGRIAGGSLTGGQAGGNIQFLIDKAHEVGAWVESHPAARTTVDQLWKIVMVGGEGLDPAREELATEKAQLDVESMRLASAVPFPEDAMVATLARQLMGITPALASSDALSEAAALVDENRDQMLSEFESLTQTELLEELQAEIEGQTPLGRAVENTLGTALTAFEWWDAFTQTIGVNVIDALLDQIGAGVEFVRGDWEEGFRRLQDVFVAAEPSDPTERSFLGLTAITAADYFDLEGGAADLANLAVGIGFDPFNLLFPGAKGVRQLAKRALVNPKFAGLYLRSGQFPHIAKQIAETTGAKAIRNVAALSGLDNPEIIDLVKLALDPDATVGQVNAVWTRALEKDWLGEGPGRAIRHSTIEGLGRTLESVAAGRISDEHLGSVMQMFSKLSVGRTFRLGENQSLDNFADLLTQFFPADKDKFADWFLKAVERQAAAGDELAMKGVSQLQKETARRAARNTGGAVRSIQGGADIRGVGANLRTIEDSLANIDQLGIDDASAAVVREQLERTHAVMSRRFEEAAPKLAEQRARKRVAQKQVKQATYLEADVANSHRNVMGGVVAELYDGPGGIAEQLNSEFGFDVIPLKRGMTHPLNPDVGVRDWSAVTGSKKIIAGDDPDLSLMMGLAVDDADAARGLDAMGMFNRSQKTTLPASPYEVLLFRHFGKNDELMSKAVQFFRSDRLKKTAKRMKLVFATNLLVNPLTAGKITLDETLRFLADTGDIPAFLRATTAGIPAVGRGSEAVIQKFKARFGDAVVNPYGLAHKRNVGGFSADDFADYGWVTRPPRRVGLGQMSRADYREQAERWVNGTLLQDRRFREYARWVDQAQVLDDGTLIPPKGFVDWWETGDGAVRPGKTDVRQTTVTIRGQAVLGTELTASDAFNILGKTFDQWVELVVDENQKGALKRALLEAARGTRPSLDVVKDAHFLNSISQIPGLSGDTGVGSQIFNVFFGAPSGRRAGVFYESYFDEAMEILTQRHAGKIITVEHVMEAGGVDRPTAQFWLKQGADNKVVAGLVADTGMVTEARLAARAATYAERRSDDLMYRFTSSSLVGRGVESGLVLPFARAQVDFLSWWVDHMFKPMATRLAPEMRSRLPGAVQSLVGGVERIPVNLRAWSKYAHIVSAVNNDNPSWVDQTIDSLTFFPVRFDSNFLLNVSPQFGPVPSWLFDIMVDKGWITPEVEANFEAIFPALEFTEFEGDYAGDLLNRWLPNSRRSLRDLTVGMMRAGAALGGSDVHTDPGFFGTIANMIAEEKVPAATGDFQAALVADLLKERLWELTPGSDEWNQVINEVAVRGAVEANREEWGQDFNDRVFPLAGADRQYRALRAFEGLFDDRTFQDLERAGVFTTSDLLDVDGELRIQGVWRKYQSGEATQDELAWLDDRLTTAYFEAGRLEVMPGFSYLDWLNITNPEIAVNLINKSEDSGIPVRSDEHAEFKRLYVNKITGRLQNVPPGDTGREVISEARRRGWIVSRPVEEWATDAAEAVYKSAQRALRGVWETVSHRTWAQGLKKAIEDKTFTLGPREARVLAATGLVLEAGQEYTYAEFHDVLDTYDERFNVAQPVLIDTLARGTVHSQLARQNDKYGQGLLDNLANAEREFSKVGIDSVEDWPEASKEKVRELFSGAIDRGYTTLADYRQEIEPIFGPIDYQPPVPPPVAEVQTGLRLTGDELADLEVIDGDTLSVMTADGAMRVRLIGINAPEATQEGYAEARDQLARVLENAEEVVLAVFDPETFGLSQLTAPGEHRLLLWLNVDGVWIYDPSVFGADNQRGAGVGGTVLDLQAILEAGRG